MTYDRHGMDVARARELTLDESLDDAGLERAEDDLVDLVLGYRPVPVVSDYPPARLEQSRAFGRAVAWQAAHRAGLAADPDALDPGVEVTSEAFPDYTVGYAPGAGPRGSNVSPHALAILTTAGLRRLSGYTTGGHASRPPDPWRDA